MHPLCTTVVVTDRLDAILQEFLDYGRTKNLSPLMQQTGSESQNRGSKTRCV